MINVLDEEPVFLDEVEDGEKSFLPGIVGVLVFQDGFSIFDRDPFDEIADIGKMIVEGLSVDGTVLADVLDGYLA